MRYSIVITAYNRDWCIERSIDSAINFLSEAKFDGELIIIDDGSSDSTVEVINSKISSISNIPELKNRIKLTCLEENSGVCVAKNTGTTLAQGDWIIFLDSDDELIPRCFSIINEILDTNKGLPAYFFNTINAGQPIQSANGEFEILTLNSLIIDGTKGRDAVPVIKSDIKRKYLFDESLRGYEGLSYLAIANEFKIIPFYQHPIIRVHSEHNDRLSSNDGINKRWRDIARGHNIVLKKYWSCMNFFAKFIILLRLSKANFLHLKYVAFKKLFGYFQYNNE